MITCRVVAASTLDTKVHDNVRAGLHIRGCVTVRHSSRLHHIGLGRALAGAKVIMLIADLDIRVIDRDTGRVIRALTLDPTRDYQPRGLPLRPPKKHP